MSYLTFSKRLANYLTVKAGLEREQELVLTYVIEILALNLLGIVLALVLGLLLGVLPGTALGIMVAFLYRHTAGGAHSNSPWRCGIVTIAIYPLLALLATKIAQFESTYAAILSIAAVLLGFLAIIILAPVDSPAAPIISPARRKRLKIWALAILSSLSILLLALSQSQGDWSLQLQLCVALNILWVSLMLTKWGHTIMFYIDKIKID